MNAGVRKMKRQAIAVQIVKASAQLFMTFSFKKRRFNTVVQSVSPSRSLACEHDCDLTSNNINIENTKLENNFKLQLEKERMTNGWSESEVLKITSLISHSRLFICESIGEY